MVGNYIYLTLMWISAAPIRIAFKLARKFNQAYYVKIRQQWIENIDKKCDNDDPMVKEFYKRMFGVIV